MGMRKANSGAGRMDSQRAAGQGDAEAHSETRMAPVGGAWAVGFAVVSPHLGRPRAANPCAVFRVDFAVGVDLQQSCDIV